eukprot:356312-Chlamydomonas_euryale.AAC.6
MTQRPLQRPTRLLTFSGGGFPGVEASALPPDCCAASAAGLAPFSIVPPALSMGGRRGQPPTPPPAANARAPQPRCQTAGDPSRAVAVLEHTHVGAASRRRKESATSGELWRDGEPASWAKEVGDEEAVR